MIKDNIQNAHIYYGLSPLIKKGLEFLVSSDLSVMKPGRYDLDENMYVNIDEYETKVSDNIEAHREYIDIQYIISGEENIGVTSLKNLTVLTEYDAEKDIIFYNGKIALNPVYDGDFLILYPQDAHLPCQVLGNKRKVKKAVVKVKLN